MIKLNGLYVRKGDRNYWQIVKVVSLNPQGLVFSYAFEDSSSRSNSTIADFEKIYRPAPVDLIRKAIDIISYQSSSLIEQLEYQCSLIESQSTTEKLQRSIANASSQEELMDGLKKIVESSGDGSDVILAPTSVLMSKISSIDEDSAKSRRKPVFDTETVQSLADRVAALSFNASRRRGSYFVDGVVSSHKSTVPYDQAFLDEEDIDSTDNE